MITIFKRQIAKGGPVTITHPEMTRYFMTIPEAASLVVQAGSIGGAGDLRPRHGRAGRDPRTRPRHDPPVRQGAGARDPVEFIGVRAGEKLHEELWGEDEEVAETGHPKIRRAAPIAASWLDEELTDLERLVLAGETLEVVSRLSTMMRSPVRLGQEQQVEELRGVTPNPRPLA